MLARHRARVAQVRRGSLPPGHLSTPPPRPFPFTRASFAPAVPLSTHTPCTPGSRCAVLILLSHTLAEFGVPVVEVEIDRGDTTLLQRSAASTLRRLLSAGYRPPPASA